MTAPQDAAQTYDFGAGLVPAHRHKNPDGSEGGWIADSALVCGNAQVCGDARVCGDALVYGNARVYGNALVCGNAQVCGNDYLMGRLLAYDWSAWVNADGTASLRYGCVLLPVATWRKAGRVRVESEAHVATDEVDAYCHALDALLALCEATLPIGRKAVS